MFLPSKKIITSRYKQRGNIVIRVLPGQDPFFGQVVLLLDAEEAGAGSKSISPTVGPTFDAVEASGGVSEVSTTEAKFGTRSLRSNDTTGLTKAYWEAAAASADFGFGTGDFTIEYHVFFLAQRTNTFYFAIWDFGTDRAWAISLDSQNAGDYRTNMLYSTNGTNSLGGLQKGWGAGALNTWFHVAHCRDGNNLRHFADGVQAGATDDVTGADFHTSTTIPLILQGGRNDGFQVQSFVDNIRITKGAARYTAPFTPPDAEYPDF